VAVRSGVLAALTVALLGVAGSPAASSPRPAGSSFHVVRADPRLCPSPICGGYWVSRANYARTRCHDGLLRPRCYVASAVGDDRQPLATGVPDGALARATIEPRTFGGFGELGVLVVADLFSPAGRAQPSGRFFRLVDTGIRCIRAPCFFVRASTLNRSSRTTLSGVAILGVVPDELVARVEKALHGKSGVLAQGRVAASSDGGRVLRPTRFFLGSES
jgi:hypothetical protein